MQSQSRYSIDKNVKSQFSYIVAGQWITGLSAYLNISTFGYKWSSVDVSRIALHLTICIDSKLRCIYEKQSFSV